MKKLLLGLAFFTVLQLNAQNYLINFTGSGATTSVTTVTVENLTKGTSLSLNGTDILNLTTATGVNSPEFTHSSNLKIYPNPMNENSTLDIFPPVAGDAFITISEITGKTVTMKKVNLQTPGQGFKLSGLKNGLYLVNVKGTGYQFSGKLVSNGSGNGVISLEKTNSIIQSVEKKEVTKETRALQATVDMAYSNGDLLKFTGASGNYRTIVMDVPAASKAENFNFILCRDADYNIYSIVTIGTQTWMAENLKTTKYNDGSAITPITDAATWTGNSTGAYADYLNLALYSTTFGRLYNWYAIGSTNAKNACPTGWHMPSNADWGTLSTNLGGASVAAGKLKETGVNNWVTPNAATNESGFTALPGGYRDQSGAFHYISSNGMWWTATEGAAGATWAYYYNMLNSTTNLTSADIDKHNGMSVRCIIN